MSDFQAREWVKRGSCDKREIPTPEEIAADDAETERRLTEIAESLNRGVVPGGVMVCGPGYVWKV